MKLLLHLLTSLHGPLRPILRRNAMSAFGGTAEVWVERALMT